MESSTESNIFQVRLSALIIRSECRVNNQSPSKAFENKSQQHKVKFFLAYIKLIHLEFTASTHLSFILREHQSTLHAFRDSRPCWHPPVTATRRRYVNLDRNFQCFFFPAATDSRIVWLQIKEEIFQSFYMTDFILSSFLAYECSFVIF